MTAIHDSRSPAPIERTVPPLIGIRSLHLLTLFAFAITQPLLTALAKQSVYLHDQRFGWLEIGYLLTMLVLIVPSGVVSLDRVAFAVSQHFRGRGRDMVMAVLWSVCSLSIIRPLTSGLWLTRSGFAGLLTVGLAIVCTCLAVFLYRRASWFRSWLTFASIGLVFFPGKFVWEFERICLAEKQLVHHTLVQNPVPVVFVILDEFSGITLLDEHLEVDSQRFPQFARLAGRSTWFRNATTNHPRTDMAVPTILSGRFPIIERPPLANEYPGNLFQVIDASKAFKMAVFEPITRLCPESLQKLPRVRTSAQKCMDLTTTLVAVFPRLILTSDTPVWVPPIPKAWFGASDMLDYNQTDFTNSDEGWFRYSGAEHRDRQANHFLNCLHPSDEPRFCFIHFGLPHFPWSFLPSGEQYESEFAGSKHPAGARGELGEDWDNDPETVLRNEYRYRLQVGYVDRFIGQMLDRLEESDLLDRCLLIVMADHGVSFQPGHSRRLPDHTTLADILSIPLFIKFPGQTERRTDDRNVESMDILPTIADILKIELPEPVDGISVSSEMTHPRKSFYYQGKTNIVEPDLPQRSSAVRRQIELFGNNSLDRIPAVAVSHPDWHGREINSFSLDERTIPFEMLDSHNQSVEQEFSFETVLAPRMIAGQIEFEDLSHVPSEVILAIDGVVYDSRKTYLIRGSQHGFDFVIPTSMAGGKTSPVELFMAVSEGTETRLQRMKPSKH